jgi:hypothetical protein
MVLPMLQLLLAVLAEREYLLLLGVSLEQVAQAAVEQRTSEQEAEHKEAKVLIIPMVLEVIAVKQAAMLVRLDILDFVTTPQAHSHRGHNDYRTTIHARSHQNP